ncbi:unnamed protein product [Phyllotreta striolata]|uniref:Transmembrane protein 234 n=1 Tax=Phyllotreta striolata TaxID=444603 RepID=A0A9N9TU30_PHYSR|nr:unnamed protein product [Phyllotreta striolata]
MFLQILSLLGTGILWGTTNPLIKKNSKDILKVKGNSRIAQFALEIKYLATNLQYLFPMLINQLGSVLYYLTLTNADITLAVPVANSLAFVFTAISGWFIEKEFPKIRSILGAVLVISGTVLCCIGKYEYE